MTFSALRLPAAFRRRCLAVALSLLALLVGGTAQAQIVDFYVAQMATSDYSSSLLEYTYDVSSKTLTQIGGSISTGSGMPLGVAAANQYASDGGIQLSGDGRSLSYSGFTTGATTNADLLFDLGTKSVGTITHPTGITQVRSSYTYDGSSLYLGGTSNGPKYVAAGGTTPTTLSTTPTAPSSLTHITYNAASQNLYFSALGSTTANSGIYTPHTNGSGLITSAAAFDKLSGTGAGAWVGSYYNSFSFLGTSTLFVADGGLNGIDVYTAADPTSTTDWNLGSQLLRLDIGSEMIQQLSVTQIDADNALIFFTTSGGTTDLLTSGTSTFNEVSWNSSTGFGDVNVLGSSLSSDPNSQYFTGIAAVGVVPEPGTYALFGLAAGLFGLMAFFKKSARSRA